MHSRVRIRRICDMPRGRDAHNPHVRKPLCPVHPLMALFRTRAGIHRILREKRPLEPWAMRAWDASVAVQQAFHRLKHVRDLVLRLLVHPAVPLQRVRVRARQRWPACLYEAAERMTETSRAPVDSAYRTCSARITIIIIGGKGRCRAGPAQRDHSQRRRPGALMLIIEVSRKIFSLGGSQRNARGGTRTRAPNPNPLPAGATICRPSRLVCALLPLPPQHASA